METKIISDEEGFRQLQEDWERLEKQDSDSTYYSTFQYNYSWWQVYGNVGQKRLFIIAVYRDNKVVGIAPLMIRHSEKKGIKFNVLCFLGKGDYLTFISERQNEQSVLKIYKVIFAAIEEHKDAWDKCELTHLSNETQLLYYLLRHDKYNPQVGYLTSCPVLKLNAFDNFQQFSREGVYPRARKTNEKFRKEVSYQLKVFYGDDDKELYQRVSEVHKLEKEYLRTQKGRLERCSVFDDKSNEEFFKRSFDGNKQVVTFMLEDEAGEIIIYRICYLHRGTLYGWNTGYSPKYSYFHSLSDVLMLEMIQYIFDHRIGHQIDYGAGSYPWKFKWTDQFKVNYSFTMWNMSKNKVKFIRFMTRVRKAINAVRSKGYAH